MQPPQHSATAKPKFISRYDAAWDSDRFLAEVRTLKEGDSHPLIQYWGGVGRMDIDAPMRLGDATVTARDYLLPDKTPVVFHLRRLRMREMVAVQDLDLRAGQYLAFRMGLGQITGHASIEATEYTTLLTEGTVDRLADVLGAALIYEVGQAVIACSSAPTAAEGKP